MRIIIIVFVAIGFGFGTIGYSTEQKGTPVVVFDFGGVMAEFDLRKMLEYCADTFDIQIDELKQVIKRDIDRLAVGDIKEEEFWIQLANIIGLTLPPKWKEQYKEFIEQLVEPRQEMYAQINELRAKGYRVALFSDVTEWQAEIFREQGLYQGFSPIILSYEMGTRKPHKKAYLNLLEKLGIEAEKCIFIDDRPANIEVARAIGIKGIVYTSFEETKSALEEELSRNTGGTVSP